MRTPCLRPNNGKLRDLNLIPPQFRPNALRITPRFPNTMLPLDNAPLSSVSPVFEAMVPLPRSMASSLLALPRSCHDLAMILATIPWPCKIVQRLTMINHDLGKGSMVPLAKLFENSEPFPIVTSIQKFIRTKKQTFIGLNRTKTDTQDIKGKCFRFDHFRFLLHSRTSVTRARYLNR